jgi:hypothetical protein
VNSRAQLTVNAVSPGLSLSAGIILALVRPAETIQGFRIEH